jgi:para-nitrobenzyl esterase
VTRVETQHPVARTDTGRIVGVRVPGACLFLGVPYGADTSGPARFLPPEPVEPWPGIKDATTFGPAAPQSVPGAPARRGPWKAPAAPVAGLRVLGSMMRPRNPAESEDCLTLNVFTGGLHPSRPRPVMVWLHGGGFAAGSASSAVYDGSALARTADVVVVSVNHRLGALGYCHLGPFAGEEFRHSGNAGTLDQIAALQWVQHNIAAFGGDPGRVMIFGESGGGWKVSTLLGSPAATGLFHRAASHSGPSVTAVPPDRAAEIAAAFLAALGVCDARQLQSLPCEQVLSAGCAVQAALDDRPLPNVIDGFAPTLDARVLPAHPFSGASLQCSADVPVIVGYNRTEMTMFSSDAQLEPDADGVVSSLSDLIGPSAAKRLHDLARRRYPALGPPRLFAYALSNLVMVPFAGHIARKRRTVAADTYSYRFDLETPVYQGRLMAPHFLDVPFVFNNLEKSQALAGPVSQRTQSIADRMSSAWAAFAETGNPGSADNGLGPWAPYRAENGPTLLIDDEPAMQEGILDEDACELRSIALELCGRDDVLVPVC